MRLLDYFFYILQILNPPMLHFRPPEIWSRISI